MPVRGVLIDGWSGVLLGAVLLHLLSAPYTKVEESFNTQATHDLLFLRSRLQEYDHHEFPGVVPRTFTGAAVLATLSWPLVQLGSLLGGSKLTAQYVVRSMLGLLNVLSLCRLRAAIRVRHGETAGRWWAVACACQFHLLFYASRLLPNSLALPLVNLAAAEWMLRRRPPLVVFLFAFTTVVFRGDMMILAGIVGLEMLVSGQLSAAEGVLWGAASVLLSLGVTVPVDSLLWGRWVWPEGEVLYFNTVLNKSSDWGTAPAHWYWTSALPRAMLGAYLLLPIGLVMERRCFRTAAPALAFILLYSLLPHKELRFILPVLPLLNIPAAAALARLQRMAYPPSKDDSHRGRLACRLLLIAAAGILLCSLLPTLALLHASSLNYPGGAAMARLHQLSDACGTGPIHIGNRAAMTGVTRFLQHDQPWAYSKAEGIDVGEYWEHEFTCLLADEPEVPGYELLENVYGFHRLTLKWRLGELLAALKAREGLLQWVVNPQVYILKRMPTHILT